MLSGVVTVESTTMKILTIQSPLVSEMVDMNLTSSLSLRLQDKPVWCCQRHGNRLVTFGSLKTKRSTKEVNYASAAHTSFVTSWKYLMWCSGMSRPLGVTAALSIPRRIQQTPVWAVIIFLNCRLQCILHLETGSLDNVSWWVQVMHRCVL